MSQRPSGLTARLTGNGTPSSFFISRPASRSQSDQISGRDVRRAGRLVPEDDRALAVGEECGVAHCLAFGAGIVRTTAPVKAIEDAFPRRR